MFECFTDGGSVVAKLASSDRAYRTEWFARTVHVLTMLLVCVLAAGGARAQQAAALDSEIEACARIGTDAARLACYDALAARAREPREPRAAESSARAPAAPGNAERFAGEIAALREIQPGRLEITLVSGEVWRQTSSDRYPLRVGHAVEIYPTRFGGYFRLTAPALRGFVQVERVR